MRWYMMMVMSIFMAGGVWAASGMSTPKEVQAAIQEPGWKAVEALTNLMKADYHAALSQYYKTREKSGYMPLERFERAFERALGDIRSAAFIKEDTKRREKAEKAHLNWTEGFKRATEKTTPGPKQELPVLKGTSVLKGS